MKKTLILLFLTTLLAGCYSKRLLEEEPGEKAGSRVSAWHIFQTAKDRETQGKLEDFILRSKQSLRGGFPGPLTISETAWYKLNEDGFNHVVHYAAFDCVGVPNNLQAFGVIEAAILGEWKKFSAELRERNGQEAFFEYHTKPGVPDRFTMTFTIRKRGS